MADTNDSQSAFLTTSFIKDSTHRSGSSTQYIGDVPDNHGAGDLLIAVVTENDDYAITPDESGWTLITTDNGTATLTATYWRIATDSEPSQYSWTSNNEYWIVRMLCIASHTFDPNDPINIADDAIGSDANPTTPDITTDVDGCWLLALWGQYRATNLNSIMSQTGWGKEWEEYYHNYWGPTQGAWSKFQTSLGATGTVDWTTSVAHQWVAVIIALNPAPGTHVLSQKHAYIAVNERSSTSAFIMSREAEVSIAASSDADFVAGWYRGTNYDTYTTLRAHDAWPYERKTILKADLTEIPSDTLIESATLRIYKSEGDINEDAYFGVYAVLKNWVLNQVTHKQAATGLPWEVWGGEGPTDVDLVPLGTVFLSQGTGSGYIDIELDITRFRWWIDGTRPNYGVIIQPQSLIGVQPSTTNVLTFIATEHATTAQHPTFVMELVADQGYSTQTSSKSAYMNGQVSSSVSACIVAEVKDSSSAYMYSNRRTETLIATKDARLLSYSTYADYNTTRNQALALTNYTNKQWTILQFDLSGIPSNALINSAKIRLYNYEGPSPSSDRTSDVYVLRRSWDDRTVCWSHYDHDTHWETGGAEGLTLDRYPGSIGQHLFQNGDPVAWVEWDLSLTAVRKWVDGTIPNHGVVMDRGQQGSVFLPYFRSLQYPDSDYHPQLVIEYLLPADTASGSQSAMLMNQGKTGSTSAFLAGQGWLQPDLADGLDAQVVSGAGANTKYGNGPEVTFEHDTYDRNVFIRFPDISLLPPASEVSYSPFKLALYMYSELSSVSTTSSMYRVLRDWIELQVTFNRWKDNELWTTGGGLGDGTDKEADTISTLGFGPTEAVGWKEWTLDASKVIEWIEGELANYGVMISVPYDGSQTNRYLFRSSEYVADPTLRPKFFIEYEFLTPASDSISAYMEGGAPTETDSQSAYTAGGASTDDSQSAFLVGGIEVTDSQIAYLHGQQDTASSQSAFVRGSLDITDDQSVYLQGSIDTISSLDAFTHGLDTSSDSQIVFLEGHSTSVDSQGAYLLGSQDTTDSQDAYTKGQDTDVDSSLAYTRGGIVSVDSQDVYLKGSAEAVDSINAYTEAFGGLETYISAYLEGDVTQDLVPDGDISGGSWKNEAEGSTLWSSIDESPFSDSDYAYYDGAVGSESFEVSLSDPAAGIDREGVHQILWRTGKLAGDTITMKVELIQGVTVIASQQKVLNGFTTYDYVLSQGEIDNITNYADLRLRFTVVSVV